MSAFLRTLGFDFPNKFSESQCLTAHAYFSPAINVDYQGNYQVF